MSNGDDAEEDDLWCDFLELRAREMFVVIVPGWMRGWIREVFVNECSRHFRVYGERKGWNQIGMCLNGI